MLTPSSGTVTFNEQFTVTITVSTESGPVDPETGGATQEPSTEIPTVTASYTDPGVTITTAPGSVTISGKYISIIPISWTYLNNSKQSVTSSVAPNIGEYYKITKVDSPSSLTATCTYTIGTEPFVHTVTLGSYSTIANLLKSLVAAS